MKRSLLMLAALPLALAGCETSSPPAQTQAPVAAALMDESVPQVARQACLNEVGSMTGASILSIGEMIYSEAGSQVKVLVGVQRAPWQCTVANNGASPKVMSLTNEGAL